MLAPIELIPVNSDKVISGVISNISASGVGIIIKEPIEINSSVMINFELPGEKKFKNIQGDIIRSEGVGDKYFAHVGVNFSNLKPDIRDEINKFVADFKYKQYQMNTWSMY